MRGFLSGACAGGWCVIWLSGAVGALAAAPAQSQRWPSGASGEVARVLRMIENNILGNVRTRGGAHSLATCKSFEGVIGSRYDLKNLCFRYGVSCVSIIVKVGRWPLPSNLRGTAEL